MLYRRCRFCMASIIAALLGAAGAPASAARSPCDGPDASGIVAVTVGAAGLATGDGTEVVLAGIALRSDVAVPDGRDAGAAVEAVATGPLRFVPTAPPDRYGRAVGMVRDAEGRLLQAELVRNGLAVVRPDGVADACARALLAIEATAQTAGAGFWADSRIVSKATDAASLSSRNGLYAVVEGRIVSVGYGSRMVFLDFGRNYRADFTIMVRQALVPRLREAGIPVESLEGQDVRVRGIIEESGGPAIRITTPLALELVDLTE